MCYELCTILIIQWRSACDAQNSGSLPHSNRICTKPARLMSLAVGLGVARRVCPLASRGLAEFDHVHLVSDGTVVDSPAPRLEGFAFAGYRITWDKPG